MPSKVYSATVVGLDAQIIEVEVDVNYGLRSFNIVGLPDKAVEESKERVGAAIKSTNLCPPHRQPLRVLVSLAPADLKKEGALYDLPIALGFLLASRQTKFDPRERVALGELSLDGRLRPVKGVLSIASAIKEKGRFSEIILPKENAFEAALVAAKTADQGNKNIRVIGAENLKEVIDHLEGKKPIAPFQINIEELIEKPDFTMDLSLIKGQEYAKRALEITAAGGHNLLMQGPPGAGKTLLAKALPSLLPFLNFEESLEVTKIYSVAGFLPKDKPFLNQRPFRSPHHTASEVALIGGGNPPRPGEITLAHRGVLFLDEFPEFHRDVLESLRQPIEEGRITIARAKHSLTFPARFTLVAASNPCPCGFYGDPEKNCSCTASQIAMYRRKLSGPLMDRIDLLIEVPQIKYEKLVGPGGENLSREARKRVETARQIQTARFAHCNSAFSGIKQEKRFFDNKEKERILVNSEIGIRHIEKYCQPNLKSQQLLKKYVDSGKLSARGYHRVLKVARTIADLDQSENILFDHLSEAIMYRINA